MNRSLSAITLVLACSVISLASATPCDEASFEKVIFREDFTGPDFSPPDDDWVIGHPEDYPESCWTTLGRTFIPNRLCLPDAPDEHFPYIIDDTCVITHYNYNPYHLGTPKTTFLGGELHTQMQFEPNQCYLFEARVRWPEAPPGLVTSFFTYGYDGTYSDEIDFEFLSNEVFQPPHDVLTNTWDESQQDPEQIPIPTLNLTEWNVFRMYWCPGTCVKWTWIDPVTGDEVVLPREDTCYIPDEPMSLYFNFWAPTEDWEKAYDAGLQPDQEDNGVKYEYFIDYVEVRVPEPATGLMLLLGVSWLFHRRLRVSR